MTCTNGSLTGTSMIRDMIATEEATKQLINFEQSSSSSTSPCRTEEICNPNEEVFLSGQLERLQVSPTRRRRRRYFLRDRSRSLRDAPVFKKNAIITTATAANHVLRPSKLGKVVASLSKNELQQVSHDQCHPVAVSSTSSSSSSPSTTKNSNSGLLLLLVHRSKPKKSLSFSASSSLSSLSLLDEGHSCSSFATASTSPPPPPYLTANSSTKSSSSTSTASLNHGAGERGGDPRSSSSLGPPPPSNNPTLSNFSAMSQSLQDLQQLETISISEEMKSKKKTEKRRKRRLKKELLATAAYSEKETLNASGTNSNCVPSSSSSCAQQAQKIVHHDISVDDLAGYLEDSIVFPKKMSYMAEMMYT